MYDALNKGIKMATGDVIGILNADDVLAEDDTLSKMAAAFADPTIDGTYADIRFVHAATTTSDCDLIRKLPSAPLLPLPPQNLGLYFSWRVRSASCGS